MAEHLGYDKHDPVGRNGGNSRNGKRAKTVLTDSGEVGVEVPRDCDGSLEPVIVAKPPTPSVQHRRDCAVAVRPGIDHRRYRRPLRRDLRRAGIEGHHFQDHRPGVEEMQSWTSRSLENVYAAVFLDAIMVKVLGGQVGNRPVYAAIGVDLEGHKDILGMWAGDGGGESAKFWMSVLTELKSRGVADVFFLVFDGPKGLPDSVPAVWPRTTVQNL
jgi:transposase-like protein